MQTINIILTLTSIVAYVLTASFAVAAFVRMDRLGKDLRKTHKDVRVTLMLMMGEHIRGSIEEVNCMRSVLAELVKTEQYEQAEQLKALIAKAEKGVQDDLQQMKVLFGDKVKVENLTIKCDK